MPATAHSLVKIFQQAPRPALRPFVRRFMVVEFPGVHQDVHLPDTGQVAAFSLRGECVIDGRQRAPRAAFTGVHESLRAHEHRARHTVLLATFTPAGASAVLPSSLEAFAGATTDLAETFAASDDLDRLHDRLAEAPNHSRRISLAEDFLLARLRTPQPDPLVSAAVTWLEHGPVPRRIDELTRHIGLSQSALERRFRRVVGVSPKQFASIVRLQRAAHLRAAGSDFTAVAHAAGYYDQAHFIHDFRRATGRTPEAFFGKSPAE